MTTFTTSDREEAEKELPSAGSSKTIFEGAGSGFIWGELPSTGLNEPTPMVAETDEPIPFYGWLKEDFGVQAAKAWSEIKFKEQEK